MISGIFGKNRIFFQNYELFPQLLHSFIPTLIEMVNRLRLIEDFEGFEVQIVLDLEIRIALAHCCHGLVKCVKS
jgi:hypothetical protein